MKDKGKIIVIGSSNTDMVIATDHFPQPGETVLGGRFFMNAGGKGANQAVAAARLGGKVSFIGKVGHDVFGQQAIQNLKNEGIDISKVDFDSDNPSGVAMITIDKKAENTIVVAPGANMSLSIDEVEVATDLINASEVILIQLEIRLDTAFHVIHKANRLGKKVILNPAPAVPLPDDLFPSIDIITPNKNETELLAGIKVTNEESAKEAAKILKNKGVKTVIITLGSAGAYIYSDQIQKLIPAPKVNAVDTTAAGDAFNGALALAVSSGKGLVEAVVFANKAAALTVTRLGAQSSIPTLDEYNKYQNWNC